MHVTYRQDIQNKYKNTNFFINMTTEFKWPISISLVIYYIES